MSLPVLFAISFTVSGETRRCSCYRFGSSTIVVIIYSTMWNSLMTV